jgi:hypothetical protein
MGGIHSKGSHHFQQMFAKGIHPNLGGKFHTPAQRGNGCRHIRRGTARLLEEMLPVGEPAAPVRADHVDQCFTDT